MEQLEVLQAKLDIAELAAKYGHFCDHEGWQPVLDLFTDDAVFDAASVYGKTMAGKAELTDFYENAPGAVAHHPTSQFTEIIDETHATSSIKMIVLFHRQAFSVDYYWDVVKENGGWRIAKQTIAVVGKVKFAATEKA